MEGNPLSQSVLNACPTTGSRIGPYELGEQLGAGGMGVVFKATRADGQFHKEVAIKFLQWHMTHERYQRFLYEKEILASLDHPNICRLLDAGVAESGQPYFVMEYVQGQNLVQFAEKLGLRERLNLFNQICHAVHFAHTNLVVHRDLKPSNILVNEQGEVTLLDFGISKVLKTESADLTQTHQQVMTPDYASPEQIEGNPISTASDIYGLGLLLFELITGVRPFAGASSSNIARLQHAILEHQPPLPSSRFEPPARLSTPSQKRWLVSLREDLDWVCLKALEKKPENRYSSALELADEIHGFLTGAPVTARQHHRWYKTRKFVTRNLTAVIYAGLFMALLLGASIFHTVKITQQKNKALHESQKSRQFVNYLSGIFRSSSPDNVTNTTLTAKELLDRGTQTLEIELGDQPDLRAEMLMVLGYIYHNLGFFEKSKSLLEESVAFFEQQSDRHEDLISESNLYLSYTYLQLEEYDQAKGTLAVALDHFKKQEPSSKLVSCYLEFSLLSWKQNQIEESQAYCLMAAETYERCSDCSNRQLGSIYHRFGLINQIRGELDEALIYFQKALDIADRDMSSVLSYSNDLMGIADILVEKDEWSRAEALVLKAMESRLTVLEENHPDIGQCHHFLGLVYRKQGRWQESDHHYRQALSIRTKAFGDDHHKTTHTKTNYGILLREMGRFEEAEPLYREALSSLIESYGENHWRVAVGYNNLGRLLLDMDRIDEAVSNSTSARTIFINTMGEGHQNVGITWINSGFAILEQGKLVEAQFAFEQAQHILTDALGPDHHRFGLVYLGLARIQMQQSNHAQAMSLLEKSLAITLGKFGPVDHRTAEVEIYLAACLHKLGKADEARSILSKQKETGSVSKLHNPATKRELNKLSKLLLPDG